MINNILLFIMDSCRYDVFCDADVPNLKNVGILKRAYSSSFWTLPSLVSLLLGNKPLNLPSAPENRGLYSGYKPKETMFAHNVLREDGYRTAVVSSNAMFDCINMLTGGTLRRGFDDWIISEYDSVLLDSASHIIAKSVKPLFLIILVTHTHHPYEHCNGKKHDLDPNRPEWNYYNQVKSVKTSDEFFKVIYEEFKNSRYDTNAIITSDHGELFGPEFASHSPTAGGIRFDKKLFEIPFIRGWIRVRT